MNKPYKMKIVPFAARKESGTTDSRTQELETAA